MRCSMITTALIGQVLAALTNVTYSATDIHPPYLEHQGNLTAGFQPATLFQPTFTTLEIDASMSKDALKTIDLSYVRSINLRGCKQVNEIIETLVQNQTIRSLMNIDLSHSDVSLDALRKLKQIIPKDGFIRPMVSVSGRSGHQVACIEVSISGTDLAKDPNSRWELNNEIQRPVERFVNTFYLTTQEWGQTHLQIVPLF